MRKDYESLVDFAEEIERIEKVKNDYIVSADCLRMVEDDEFEIENTGKFEINEYCHSQVADRMGIPRKYYEATGHDILEKNPGIGLGNLIKKLKDKNVNLDPALTNQIHLINQVRVFSVHKKKEIFHPSEQQTKAMILYTLDVLERIFSKV